ncbi:MAG: hypothetical protein M1814_000821 [Vezdaea aestivalis]|nr:MAG: hypothetical protein M1814_000821 [Vezdaea aestivalis]
MAGGDTGAPRSSGGKTSTDAFTKREKASEDLYVREQEKAKLLEVRKKLAESQKHVQEIEEHLYATMSRPGWDSPANTHISKALEKESGGEHK